jgi:hypothetical protein
MISFLPVVFVSLQPGRFTGAPAMLAEKAAVYSPDAHGF